MNNHDESEFEVKLGNLMETIRYYSSKESKKISPNPHLTKIRRNIEDIHDRRQQEQYYNL